MRGEMDILAAIGTWALGWALFVVLIYVWET